MRKANCQCADSMVGIFYAKLGGKQMKVEELLEQSTREEKAALIAEFIIENSSDIEYAVQTQDREMLEEIIDDWLGDEEE